MPEHISSLCRRERVSPANLVRFTNEISLLNHILHHFLGQSTCPFWLNLKVLLVSIVHLCRYYPQKTVYSDFHLYCDLLGAFWPRWDIPDPEVAKLMVFRSLV